MTDDVAGLQVIQELGEFGLAAGKVGGAGRALERQGSGGARENPGQAAETYVYLASSSEVEGVSGRFFASPRKEIAIKGQALDDAIAAKLWDVSAKAVGLD